MKSFFEKDTVLVVTCAHVCVDYMHSSFGVLFEASTWGKCSTSWLQILALTLHVFLNSLGTETVQRL